MTAPTPRKPGARLPGAGPAVDRECGHPSARVFYAFRSESEARAFRQQMLDSPQFRDCLVSDVRRSRIAGWAWTVCAECRHLHRAATAH
jgi:hypothetical protein